MCANDTRCERSYQNSVRTKPGRWRSFPRGQAPGAPLPARPGPRAPCGGLLEPVARSTQQGLGVTISSPAGNCTVMAEQLRARRGGGHSDPLRLQKDWPRCPRSPSSWPSHLQEDPPCHLRWPLGAVSWDGLSQGVPAGVRGQANAVCTRSPGRAYGSVPAGHPLLSGAPGASSPNP